MAHKLSEFLLRRVNENDIYTSNKSKENGDVLIKQISLDSIKKNIRSGAKDLSQQWRDAKEITEKAFEVAGEKLPVPSQKRRWDQFVDLAKYAVHELAKYRGMNGNWRISKPITENAESPFTIELSQQQILDVEGNTFDEILEQLTEQLRKYGAKAKIETENENKIVLSIWLNNHRINEITITKNFH